MTQPEEQANPDDSEKRQLRERIEELEQENQRLNNLLEAKNHALECLRGPS